MTEDPSIWDEACRIYGFIGAVDHVELSARQYEIISNIADTLVKHRDEIVRITSLYGLHRPS